MVDSLALALGGEARIKCRKSIRVGWREKPVDVTYLELGVACVCASYGCGLCTSVAFVAAHQETNAI